MKSMDIYELKPGDRVRTQDGAVAVILNETQDGQWIDELQERIGTEYHGTEDLCHEHELQERIGTE